MMRPAAPARPDIHARITQQIISQLEAGVRPWTRPWSHSASVSRPLRHDGTPYNGINVVLLWGEAADRGYTLDLDDLPPGAGPRRPRPQGRARGNGRLRQPDRPR
nr:ArdC family protein [Brevundimonas naejangsanensis]